MPKSPQRPAYETRSNVEGDTRAVRCGDCHATLSAAPARDEQVAIPSSSDDYYCAQCARAVRHARRCSRCGSQICPRCGAPVELADELGIG